MDRLPANLDGAGRRAQSKPRPSSIATGSNNTSWTEFVPRRRSSGTSRRGVAVGGAGIPLPASTVAHRAAHPRHASARGGPRPSVSIRSSSDRVTNWRMPGPRRSSRSPVDLQPTLRPRRGRIGQDTSGPRHRQRRSRAVSKLSRAVDRRRALHQRDGERGPTPTDGDFHHRFRKIDTLVVDDVQFIAGKERTQEEFLHTFNLLCAAGKQIVVSSDKPPREIRQSRGGLRNRFEGGLMVEVTRPDRETRRRISGRQGAAAGAGPVGGRPRLSHRAGASGERPGARRGVDASQGDGVARRSRHRSRARRGDRGRALSGRRASGCRSSASRPLVTEALDVARAALLSTQRNGGSVFARQVSMYLMRKQIGLSLASIGERYGRDHTTVLHAVRAIEARRACDPEVRRLVTTLEEKL